MSSTKPLFLRLNFGALLFYKQQEMKEMAKIRKEQRVAQALRAWQKTAKTKRVCLTSVASSLRISRWRATRILRAGVRRVARQLHERTLIANRVKLARYASAAAVYRSLLPSCSVSCRLVRDARSPFRRFVKIQRQAKKNRARMKNEEITADQMRRLIAAARFW